MSWSYDTGRKVWRCTNYYDLQYAEINNFAEYGQPVSPYQLGYNHSHVPDFGKIVIEMSQSQVMNQGYGRNITALDFPLVNRFLNNGVMTEDTEYMPQFVQHEVEVTLSTIGVLPRLPAGSHKLGDLVTRGAIRNRDRFINTNLYGWGSYGISAGNIAAGDAAYIHGTVSFALTRNTVFVVGTNERRVDAEIGAGDDNWDFNSSTINRVVNATVATLLGPTHYNLTAPIKILFRGAGKRMVASKRL